MARRRTEEESMEFLVEFEIIIPPNTAETEVVRRESAEAAAAAALVEQGHLLRVWRVAASNGQDSVLGLYRADTRAQLDGLLEALPLYDWMHIEITPLESHPNDPNVRDTVAGDESRG
jgi:muconolactone delta-isomerase